MDDPVAIIKEDHQQVGALFEQYRSATDPAQKQHLFAQIAQGLSQHAEMEEQVLYPQMQEALGEDKVEQNLDEHSEMKQAIGELQAMPPGPEMDGKMEELISAVLEHVRLEEEDELPSLQQRLTPDQLSAIGQRMAEFKRSAR